jgi:hypothetical protein
MRSKRAILGPQTLKRIAAVAACVMLLCFAAGGSLFHQHKNGNEATCQICQSLHAPAVAASVVALLSTPTFIAWYSPRPPEAPASTIFSHDHAGRAPPSV